MRFKLKSPHSIDDMILEADTEIIPAIPKRDAKGNVALDKERRPIIEKQGTIYLVAPVTVNGPRGPVLSKEVPTNWFGPPSVEMEGLDDEAKKLVEARISSYMNIDNLPIKGAA